VLLASVLTVDRRRARLWIHEPIYEVRGLFVPTKSLHSCKNGCTSDALGRTRLLITGRARTPVSREIDHPDLRGDEPGAARGDRKEAAQLGTINHDRDRPVQSSRTFRFTRRQAERFAA
jgi:hypothetical protein